MSTLFLLMLISFSALADDPDDDDGDGYGESSGDCDDHDASVYPGATEHCDGVDQDCDGVIDEGTECYDDDGDSVTEQEGDCDDGDPTIYPNAMEICDGIDQDCDDFVDEGTECYDDDGDGYAESEGDCDDADATRSPGRADWCRDGVDNDCDGNTDNDCVEDPADGCDPDLSVTLSLSQFSAWTDETVTATAAAEYNDSALEPQYAWEVDAGTLSGQGASIEWTLPPSPGEFTISVVLTDDCGFQDYELASLPVERPTQDQAPVHAEASGCFGRAPAALLLLLPLGWRRRR